MKIKEIKSKACSSNNSTQTLHKRHRNVLIPLDTSKNTLKHHSILLNHHNTLIIFK